MIKTGDLTVRQKKIVIVIIAIFVLYLLFGFLAAPFVVDGIVEKQVAEAIGRKIAVGAVRVNPITLSVTLRDVDIRETDDKPFVHLDEAYANVQTFSLFKWALVLKSVRLVSPDIRLVRTGEATFNFSDIGKTEETEPVVEEKPADDGGFGIAIYDLRIDSGRIAMDDRVVSVDHRIEDLHLHLSDFSTRKKDAAFFSLIDVDAKINGAILSVSGKARPFDPSRQTEVEIDISQLSIVHYLPYIPLPENLKIESSVVEAEAEIDFRMGSDDRPELVVAGPITLEDVRLADGKGDPFVNNPLLAVDFLPSKVLTGELRLAHVETKAPEYFLKRLPTGSLYLPFLTVRAYDKAEEKSAGDETGDFELRVTVDQFSFADGVVHYTDLANSEPFTTTVDDLDVALENFGLNVDRTAKYRLSLKTEADESMALSGTASISPLVVTGEIDVSSANASRYFPYYKDMFEFRAAEGSVSLGGAYRLSEKEGAPWVQVADMHLLVEKLKVVDEDDDDPLVQLDRFQVADTTFDSSRRELTLGRVDLDRAQLVCRREKDGTLNLARAFTPAAPSAAAEPDATAKQEEEPRNADETTSPFVVNLAALKIADVVVDVEDRVPMDPVKFRVDQIAVTASDLSTAKNRKGKADLSMRWEQSGTIHMGGDVTISPLSLDMAVDLDQLDVRPFQPYLSEQAGIIVTKGFAGTQGRLKLSGADGHAPTITYDGKIGLNRFASIDKANANDFLNWESLALDNLQLGINPTRLSIDQVSLSNFFARVIVSPDGSVNLVSMFSGSDAGTNTSPNSDEKTDLPEEKPASDAESTPIRISRVTVSGGTIDFSDRLIKPNFNAKFHDLAGRVSGLESIREKRADVLLEGMWSNHAPVRITGQINPLIENPYVDLNLTISDIELSPFSPYSGKYMGYIVEKGKLTFNVEYLMEEGKLEGKNSIAIQQLTLGDSVESIDAVNLPIKLAIALLKDREGNINLDLPVSGNVDDPEFRVGKAVVTVLKNLIVKIVTSPFAALGALVDGGEELSYLDFDAGESEIGPENAEKMDKLATVLYERPGLNLDVRGTAVLEADRDALRARLLENSLKAKKLQRIMKSGKGAVPLDEIVVDEAERPELLSAVFEESGIPLPKDEKGKPVEPTPETVELLLRTHTEVTEDDFRKLANARALAAKSYLMETGQVDRNRIFIVASKVSDSKADDGGNKGQVVFSLK